MNFYKTLAKAMEAKEMSAADVCSRAGIHPSYISKLKSGHVKDVTWEKAMLIIGALDMTPDEFYKLQRNDN